MAEWLLAHDAILQFCVLVAALAAIAVWETYRPRRPLATATPTRWLNNVALAGVNGAIARWVLPIAGVAFASVAEQRGWGLLHVVAVPPLISLVVAVACIDGAQYGLHRMFHASPLLWRIHKVHHSDLDVDGVTALRHHPLEYVLVIGADLLLIGCLGASPLAVVMASILSAGTSVFAHGNVAVPTGIDRVLRRFLVTPDMHRIHHSMQYDECNANYSMVFPWWDHLFGTYREFPRLGHARMTLGIVEARSAADVSLHRLLLLPFRRDPAARPARIHSTR